MLEQQIEPCFIGIHSMNRDGHGIAWKDAERLMEAILDVGFDVGSVIQPTCSERLAGDNDSHVFNERISQESRGRVPSIPDQHLKYLSLSCSHLNTTLRMIAAGAKCSEELSCSENGTISMHKVENKDPTYASYARSGLKWNVISQHVMGKWPELAQLIQAALNTGSAVAKEERDADTPEDHCQACYRPMSMGSGQAGAAAKQAKMHAGNAAHVHILCPVRIHIA